MIPGFISVTSVADIERTPISVAPLKTRIAISMIYGYKGHLTPQYAHAFTAIIHKEGNMCETFKACETPEEIDQQIAQAVKIG